ncbi:hypothetical protein J437_LFUL008179 [Ladona fulva]|uniref:Ammonium transporter AmtB-like domain-containing protein n=1 Tax=Ladona fulva TaxID=123851 RepID=A0A8K0K8U9_LADFU|nr:hypothetical protein J437_LFUL008179 [Ladona fulva]
MIFQSCISTEYRQHETRSKSFSRHRIKIRTTNIFIILSIILFFIQGFGLLESGCVSVKNEVNIMMKNVVDVVLGGLTYWVFGFGLSFGNDPSTTPFVAIGDFMLDALPKFSNTTGSRSYNRPTAKNASILHEQLDMGPVFATFLFQLSFATTATTIVSGAMAERCNFKAYCLFSLLNTVIYCVPAGWVWGDHGFLHLLGVVDIAGSGPVHLIGGSSGRYEEGLEALPQGSPVNAVMGLFVLWWGWLAFNSGSTLGVSGAKWEYAARAAVMTVLASFGGGIVGLFLPFVVSRKPKKFQSYDIMDFINGILGSLVAITAGCFLYRAWEAIIVGMVGGIIACFRLASIWGVLAVGIFAENPVPLSTTSGRSGLLKGGGWYLLGVQALSCLCLGTWGFFTTILILWIVNKIIPIRMEEHEELLGHELYLDKYIAMKNRKEDLKAHMPKSGKMLHLGSPTRVYPASSIKLGKAGRLVLDDQLQQNSLDSSVNGNNKINILENFSKKEFDSQPTFAWVD